MNTDEVKQEQIDEHNYLCGKLREIIDKQSPNGEINVDYVLANFVQAEKSKAKIEMLEYFLSHENWWDSPWFHIAVKSNLNILKANKYA
jgi:hypothetical protein